MCLETVTDVSPKGALGEAELGTGHIGIRRRGNQTLLWYHHVMEGKPPVGVQGHITPFGMPVVPPVWK